MKFLKRFFFLNSIMIHEYMLLLLLLLLLLQQEPLSTCGSSLSVSHVISCQRTNYHLSVAREHLCRLPQGLGQFKDLPRSLPSWSPREEMEVGETLTNQLAQCWSRDITHSMAVLYSAKP